MSPFELKILLAILFFFINFKELHLNETQIHVPPGLQSPVHCNCLQDSPGERSFDPDAGRHTPVTDALLPPDKGIQGH